jgi:non-ribosomal peptide synthetase component F
VSGRTIDHPGVEKTIGPMFNTLPFWVDIHSDDTLAEVIIKCQDFNMAALPYQHTPLRDTSKWCKQPGSDALFDSLFVFQKIEEADTSTTNKLWTEIEGPVQADYPLAFEAVYSSDNNLSITIVAQGSTADTTKCNELMEIFGSVLRTALKDPQQRIAPYAQSWLSARDTPSQPSRFMALAGEEASFDWTETALLLREEIAKVAGMKSDEVSPTTSIFELSLDSIDAIQLSANMKKHKISLPVSLILRQRTIAKMASSINNDISASPRGKLEADLVARKLEEAVKTQLQETGSDTSSIVRILPTTPLQEGMIADMLASDYTTYFNHDVLRLRPDIDMMKLKQAAFDVIAQSPILRTSFLPVDEPDIATTFAQIEHDIHPDVWQQLEIRFSTWDGMYETIRNTMQTKREDIPFKLTVVQKEVDQYLVLSISHALYDGWSIGLLHEDIQRAYEGCLESRPDFGIAVTDMVEAGTSEEATSFWRNTFVAAKPSLLPRRHEEALRTHREELRSKVELKLIQELCRAQGITIQAMCQSCWAFTLASFTQSLDVTFGTVLSGRDDDEAQAMLFPTMNTVAIRAVIHGTASEMLSYMQTNHSDVVQYQHFPLRKIKALAQMAGEELFNTLFIFQKRPETTESARPLYESIGGSSSVEYPVAVEADVVDQALVWRTACQAAYMNEIETSEILRRLDSVLKVIVNDPEAASLKFEQNKVSVCGLPSFAREQESHAPKKDTSMNQLPTPTNLDPWTSTEQAVREALSVMSGVPEKEIGKHQTIFHIGLDSISAIKAVSYLSRKKSVRITVSAMLKAGTVEKIAAVIDSTSGHKPEPSPDVEVIVKKALSPLDVDKLLQAHEIAQDNVEKVIPATASQVYFLSSWQNSNGELFCPTFRYRLYGNVGVTRLKLAWERLVSQHAMLRTTFVATGQTQIPFVLCVLRDVGESFFVEARPSRLFSALRAPATLSIETKGTYVQVELQIHHALYDAVSLAILVEELANLCRGESPSSSTSQDVMNVVTSIVPTASSDRKDFWTSYLAGISESRTSESSSHQGYKPRTVSYRPNAVKNIEKLSPILRTQGISLQALFLAALAASQQPARGDDVIFGVYFANRATHPRLAAPTLCIVPIRVRLLDSDGKERGPLDVARYVQADLQRVSAQDIVGTGLWEVEEWTGVRIDQFMNFLVDFADEEVKEGGQRDIYIVENDQSNKGQTTTERSSGRDDFTIPLQLQHNAVKHAFVPSIDVEAAVRNGALDIGVFGPKSMVTEDEADGLVDRLCDVLRNLASGGQIEVTQEEGKVSPEDGMKSDAAGASTAGEEQDEEKPAPLRSGPRRATRFVWPRPVSVLLGRSDLRKVG